MPYIEMSESHKGRWIVLAVLGLVLASLLFPALEGLSAGFTSDLYVLFAVPTGAHVEKVVYTTSDPVIVMSAA